MNAPTLGARRAAREQERANDGDRDGTPLLGVTFGFVLCVGLWWAAWTVGTWIGTAL